MRLEGNRGEAVSTKVPRLDSCIRVIEITSNPMAHGGQTETFKFEFQSNIMTKQKEMENKTVPKITMTSVVQLLRG